MVDVDLSQLEEGLVLRSDELLVLRVRPGIPDRMFAELADSLREALKGVRFVVLSGEVEAFAAWAVKTSDGRVHAPADVEFVSVARDG